MFAKRTSPTFLRFHLTTSAVSIGQRVKKGTFRPCVETLPTSTLMGAFREQFGLKDILAIGFFDPETYRKDTFTYAPFDAMLGTPKLPLTLEYLAPKDGHREVEGEVYVVVNNETRRLFANNGNSWAIGVGALRSKGFGQCILEFEEEVIPAREVGYLRGSLRLTDAPAFGMDPQRDIIRPTYGFLFRPDEYRISGRYELAVFPGSIIQGPAFLIEGRYEYDR